MVVGGMRAGGGWFSASAAVRSRKCWQKQPQARIRWLVMNSQLTINLFQECPAECGRVRLVCQDRCWGDGGGGREEETGGRARETKKASIIQQLII